MGIYKLMSLLLEKSPNAIKKCQLDRYSGRIIACDASMVKLIILIINLTGDLLISGFYLRIWKLRK